MKQRARIRFVGISFDHMHMGDLLGMVQDHPDAELVGICDAEPARMREAATRFALPGAQVYTDLDQCLDSTKAEVAVLCPATALHADYVEQVASRVRAILVEKPFAASTAEADRMIAASRRHRTLLAINWPLRWVASHCTAYRLLREGRIGQLEEVHYYDGNRGPLFHGAGKAPLRPTSALKRRSWFYRRDLGGGSLLDYLGYGTTLGTWFHEGRKPLDVTSVTHASKGLEVDEHSVTIAKYACGLSKFETRWGTFTDPWTFQPQPKCGFVLKGSDGTLSSYDYEMTVQIQTRRRPGIREVAVDRLEPPFQNPIQYLIDCLANDRPLEGPLSTKISRIGQQIVDTAIESSRTGRTVALLP